MGAGYSIKARANRAAEILLYEDVGAGFNGVTAAQFASDLKQIGNVDRIDLRINSAGGDAFEGLAIYNRLAEHPAQIVAHIDGVAASIASVIALAADEVHIPEAAFVMIHDAWGIARGNSKKFRDVADRMDQMSGAISDIYVKRTGIDDQTIRQMMEVETWMTGLEAVKNKFADKIVEGFRIVAFAGELDRFDRTPTLLRATSEPPPIARPLLESAQIQIAALKAQMNLRKQKLRTA